MIDKNSLMYALYNNTLRFPQFRATYIGGGGDSWQWGLGWLMNSRSRSFFCKFGIIPISKVLS